MTLEIMKLSFRGFFFQIRPRLFEGRIALSTGYIIIQRISIDKTNHAIHWIVIYPLDSVIHLSNNWGQNFSLTFHLPGQGFPGRVADQGRSH